MLNNVHSMMLESPPSSNREHLIFTTVGIKELLQQISVQLELCAGGDNCGEVMALRRELSQLGGVLNVSEIKTVSRTKKLIWVLQDVSAEKEKLEQKLTNQDVTERKLSDTESELKAERKVFCDCCC